VVPHILKISTRWRFWSASLGTSPVIGRGKFESNKTINTEEAKHWLIYRIAAAAADNHCHTTLLLLIVSYTLLLLLIITVNLVTASDNQLYHIAAADNHL
jgi:hypothetical protein